MSSLSMLNPVIYRHCEAFSCIFAGKAAAIPWFSIEAANVKF